MINRITYLLVLLCCTLMSTAQNNAIFGGGTADGYDKESYQQLTPFTVEFTGGNGDGHSKDCYTQTTPLSVSFFGGSNDGHAKDCYIQIAPQTVAFTGGSNDGHAKDCYIQIAPQTVAFSGGNNDGYAKDCFTQQSNLNNIFSGGDGGDGMLNGCANEPLGCFLAINLGNDTTFCAGQTLTLDAGSFPGGGTYLWQDSSKSQTFVVNTSGVYYVFVMDTAGCTGIDSITVTVNPVPVVDLGADTAFCAGNNLVLDAENSGATYVWQNGATAPYFNQTFTVNTTGTYYVTASYGVCSTTDSIVVIVNPIATTNLPNSTICQGDTALIFGNYQTIAGTYRDTILASTGCDSILVQQLIVNPTYNQNLGAVNICAGDSALILGNYEMIAGVYSDTLSSINGCDSIVTQTLNVSPSHNVTLGADTAFCAGSNLILDAGAGANSYQWMNGSTSGYLQQTFTVNTTGTYFVVTTLGACTTSDTINVTVNPNQSSNLANSIICQGDSALIFGTYQTVAGNYYDTLQTVNGCDSLLIQQLIVNPTYNQNLGTVSICAGDSALILGNYETVAGVYTDTLSSINGCDSIVTQTLSVLSNSSVNLGADTTFCAGNSLTLDAGAGASSYQWVNGTGAVYTQQTFTVNTTGTYFVVVTTGACSASDTINVTINPIQTTNLPDSTICQGDSALIFGNYETLAGTYYNTLTSVVTGCDSILVQQLIVNPTYNVNLGTVNICAGDSALILGNYETVAGTYIDTLQTVNGCDSIVSQTLNIDATPIVNLGNDTTFCSGNNLTLDAGAGATSYQWMNGSTSGYLQQTFTVNNTGTYYVTATIGVCSATDSIDVTVIQPVYTNYADSVVCQGDSALIFGNYETVAGTYYETLTSVITGCDSILVQQLVVNPTYNYALAPISICAGDSALIFGNYESVAGVYYDSTQTVNGCDSIVSQTLNINVAPTVNLGNDTTFCSGNNLTLDAGAGATSYQWMNGTTSGYLQQTFTVNNTGTYYVTATIGVCSTTDSIDVTVIQPVYTNYVDSVVCQGDGAMIFGNYETVAGTYYETLTSVITGCDSILVQQLVVNPTYNYALTPVSICDGESALIFGNYESVAGVYYDSTQTVNGCDSIVSQTLNVNPTPVVNIGSDTTFCSGNNLTLDAGAGATSYQWMSGTTSGYLQQTFTVNSTGTYYVTATIGVCSATDSIDVTVIQPIYTNLTDIAACQGDGAMIFGNYETIAGTYYDTLAAVTTCDSILVQQLIINPNVSTNTNTTICTGDSILLGGSYQTIAGVYYDTLTSATSCDSLVITELFVIPGYVTNISDTICEGESLFAGGAYQTVTGIYYDSLQAINGCDSLVITDLLVNPKPTVIATATPNFIVAGESAQLQATGGGTYTWSPLEDLSCGTCANPVASPLETTIYTVTVDSNGCIVSDTTLVEVDDEFFIPEGFSPNNDGVNDMFEIVGIAKYPNNTITIINRWGNKVFEAAPYKSDWDGTNQYGVKFGDKLPTGTYFYILNLGKDNPTGNQEIKGYIYLNR